LSRHFGPRALNSPLLADPTQQIGHHVFKALKMHHGVVLLHRRDGMGYGRIMNFGSSTTKNHDYKFSTPLHCIFYPTGHWAWP
jgi:hypothetical protein